MNLPRSEDLNVHGSLDEIAAHEHFHGKTLEEAEALFRENSAYYQEDLMWMGPRAFAFYLQAALNYLQSDAAAGDDGLVNALYDIVEFRLDEEEFPLALDVVNRLVGYVIDHYQKFEVDSSIYGDLLGKYKQLQEKLKSMV